ncbi:MAG: hypothetical protein GC181_08600 [Bacteroidetes bacterium]|nr:hypothetical protein [Bacteroidota bacterium]
MNTTLDPMLSQINGLKWLPWIGAKYQNLAPEHKILIVGESHYQGDDKESIVKHQSPGYTRRVVNEMAIKRDYYQTRIFPNLHRAIFQHDTFECTEFWSLVSFYNFVQRPMNTIKERPKYEDLMKSWETFFELIELIDPHLCLFIGVNASNSFMNAAIQFQVTLPQISRAPKVDNTFPRIASFRDKSGGNHKVVFIKHTSRRFSWPKWNLFLNQEIPKSINWLNSQLQ